MTQWQVIPDDGNPEPRLNDVEVSQTANPFGTYAIAYIRDLEGNRFDTYSRGTKVEFQARPNLGNGTLTVGGGDTYTVSGGDTETYDTTDVSGTLSVEGTLSLTGTGFETIFTGFVVERREREDANGTQILEVECYSYDQFLRRGTVSNDQTGNTIAEALEDIVKTDTPVTWNASNVTVGDDQELTISLRGEKVENAIRELRNKSVNEEFGVNDSLEFYFRPREETTAPRDVDNSQWFGFDIPELGKETVNEVTVFYNDGESSVTVDDGGDKLDLQESLNTDDPIAFSKEVSRPDIDNADDAKDVAEQILSDRESTLSGTVTTYGLLGATPRDVISINIVPRGIAGDFRIAEITYRWAEDATELTIVEKRGNQDDVLVRLSDTLKRVELGDVNRDGTNNRITNTEVVAKLDVTGDVDSTSYSETRFTNVARDKLRDAWRGTSNLNITQIAVGDDPSGLSRTNTDLANELARVSVSETLPDAFSAEYSGSLSESDVREVGLFDGDGDLVVRAIVPDTSFTSPVSATVTVTVSDGSGENAVLTNGGQTAVRDCIADNSPAVPTHYAYGDDDTAPAEGDTALGNQVVAKSITDILIQSSNDQASWEDEVSPPANQPIRIASGQLEDLQVCWTSEGEDFDNNDPGLADPTHSDFSDGRAAQITADADAVASDGNFVEWQFTPQHDIPSSDFSVYVRDWDKGDSDGTPEVLWSVITPNGAKINMNQIVLGSQLLLSWSEVGAGTFPIGDGYTATDPDIQAGETYTLRVEVVDSNGQADTYQYFIDVVAPFDKRFESQLNFDNDNGGSSGYLDGPELYPNVVEQQFATASTRRTLTEATATQSWNDTSNGQFIELSNDGGNNWVTTNNSSTANVTFNNAETGVDVNVGLSRFGSRSSATPQTGFNGQHITSHELTANIDAILNAGVGEVDIKAIVPPGELSNGQTLQEGAQLDTNGNALSRVVFAPFDVNSNQRVISSESLTFQNA